MGKMAITPPKSTAIKSKVMATSDKKLIDLWTAFEAKPTVKTADDFGAYLWQELVDAVK